jgi:hypothetical protein
MGLLADEERGEESQREDLEQHQASQHLQANGSWPPAHQEILRESVCTSLSEERDGFI